MSFYTNVYQNWDKLHVRGVLKGERFNQTLKYQPYLFLPDQNGTYKTIEGRRVEKKNFESISAARSWMREHEDVSGFEYYGFNQFIYPFINDTWRKDIHYVTEQIVVANIDIECAADEGFPDIDSADKEITAITVSSGGEITAFGCLEFTPTSPDVQYIRCGSEEELLARFIRYWRQLDPDVITGWNVEGFDIPYLVARITKICGEAVALRLSPWEILNKRTVKSDYGGADRTVYEVAGVATLDYLILYKKFSFKNQESYRLDHIANVELKERKLDFGDAKSLIMMYQTDPQRFMEYNIHDVRLVDKLQAKLDMLGQIFAIAYMAKINFEDALTSVRLWDVIVHNHLMKSNIVVPIQKKSKKDRMIVGGFVKEPQLGAHEWVVSDDFTSLYPKIIELLNIGPDTYRGTIDGINIHEMLNGILDRPHIRDKMLRENITIAASGCTFSREKKSFFAELMAEKFEMRANHKRKMLEAKKAKELGMKDLDGEIARQHNMQLAIKIMLNSAYGAMSNQWFRWFDDRFAESITMTGQTAVLWVELNLNRHLNKLLKSNKDYVIAIDTDSIYLNLSDFVKLSGLKDKKDTVEMVDQLMKQKINPFVDQTCKEFGDYVNCFTHSLEMKREAIADRAIWTGKKRYVMNVWDMEGVRYDKPEVKIVGIEAVKSSTPAVCREAIKKSIEILLRGENKELIDFVDQFRVEFEKFTFEQIAAPGGISNINNYTMESKGLPQHVRAALVFNKTIRDKGLSHYEPIRGGDKIKVCFLKEPNPVQSKVFAIMNELPKELGLEKYIDYDMQFYKEYVSPVKALADAANWKMEEVSSLF